MKRVILLSLVVCATVLTASDERYYFAPTIGKVIHESSDLEEKRIYGYKIGIPIKNNQYGLDTFEIAHERQKNVTYENIANTTKTNRFSGNFLKHYESVANVTPYALGGFGYEAFSNNKLDAKDGVFVNVGVGFKYKLNDYISLMTDARHLINLNGLDSHTILNAGLVISCGKVNKNIPFTKENIKKDESINEKENNSTAITLVTPAVIVSQDINNTVIEKGNEIKISEAIDINTTTPNIVKDSVEVVVLQNNVISVKPEVIIATPVVASKKDTDNDGIIDEIDLCPNTPKGFEVNNDGCEVSQNLIVNFDTNEKNVKEIYTNEIVKLIFFARAFPEYKIQISGHTDNAGNKKSNQKLSLDRANAIKNNFIENGIDISRLTVVGYGEDKPLMLNDTDEGKNENRRVEIVLSK